MNRRWTRRRTVLPALGTVLSLLASDVAAQGASANGFNVIQLPARETGAGGPVMKQQESRWSAEDAELERLRIERRQLKQKQDERDRVLGYQIARVRAEQLQLEQENRERERLLRTQLARAQEKSDELEEELLQLTRLRRDEVERARLERSQLESLKDDRLPLSMPGNQRGNQRFENTVR